MNISSLREERNEPGCRNNIIRFLLQRSGNNYTIPLGSARERENRAGSHFSRLAKDEKSFNGKRGLAASDIGAMYAREPRLVFLCCMYITKVVRVRLYQPAAARFIKFILHSPLPCGLIWFTGGEKFSREKERRMLLLCWRGKYFPPWYMRKFLGPTGVLNENIFR